MNRYSHDGNLLRRVKSVQVVDSIAFDDSILLDGSIQLACRSTRDRELNRTGKSN